ncbi:hypothetical protein K503DRAFT_787396 [Rhizopogon vinicolor AM-OR11-026]|uniref:Uncharacterized protein n=1 Tax=Rhizopogon vinicolor AM-OR11-026 TaxID=1314800 RepID=A0A1B7MHP6_9AGAM|nr:hypothetical protein K503DRAFT_787396 [Rhizopogon vinicolor AM-OR11-026]
MNRRPQSPSRRMEPATGGAIAEAALARAAQEEEARHRQEVEAAKMQLEAEKKKPKMNGFSDKFSNPCTTDLPLHHPRYAVAHALPTWMTTHYPRGCPHLYYADELHYQCMWTYALAIPACMDGVDIMILTAGRTYIPLSIRTYNPDIASSNPISLQYKHDNWLLGANDVTPHDDSFVLCRRACSAGAWLFVAFCTAFKPSEIYALRYLTKATVTMKILSVSGLRSDVTRFDIGQVAVSVAHESPRISHSPHLPRVTLESDSIPAAVKFSSTSAAVGFRTSHCNCEKFTPHHSSGRHPRTPTANEFETMLSQTDTIELSCTVLDIRIDIFLRTDAITQRYQGLLLWVRVPFEPGACYQAIGHVYYYWCTLQKA